MSAYQFGQAIYESRGLGKVLDIAETIASRGRYSEGALIAAGGLSSLAGPTLGVLATLYGAKQVYDGVKGFVER